MTVAVVVLMGLSLTPVRFLGWVEWMGHLPVTLVVPVSHPMSIVGRWLAPARRELGGEGRLGELELENQRLLRLYLVQLGETDRYKRLAETLQGGRALETDVPVRLRAVPVVGVSSDASSSLLTVRAGSREGVTPNTVATVDAVQLVGQVDGVSPRTATVRPITDPAVQRINGRVMVTRIGPDGLACSLEPTGDGRLRGDLEYLAPTPERPSVPEVAVGMTVRLDDPSWPASAQMLVLGTIERIEPSSAAPDRQVITVRPTADLRRVSEVILRIPIDAAGSRSTPREGATP
jgi:cell shape-determining protein MreC